VGSAPVSLGPRFFPGEHRGLVREVLFGHQTLESREPMVVVVRAIVGLTAIRGGLQLIDERGRYSFQVKCRCADSRTASAKACACQGSAKTGPPSSRGGRGDSARFSGPGKESGWFEVVIPHINVNRVPRRCLLSPQLARSKAHRIDVLGILAELL